MSSTELDILDPAPRVMVVRSERLEIRPLTLRKLPEMARLVEPVAPSVMGITALPEGDELLELVAGLLKVHSDALPRAVALAIDRPAKWVALADVCEFTALAVAVLAINRDFFLHGVDVPPVPKASRVKASESTSPLVDGIQFLMGRGHRYSDILDYTLAQFSEFMKAAIRSRARELRDAAVCARAAQSYDKQGFASYLKGLDHG